jgi:nucleotide-binding universal stress UspA family protein
MSKMTQGIVVVGVDGSETASKAAAAAHRLASALGVGLHITTAFDSDRTKVFGSGSDTWIESDPQKAEQIALETKQQLPSLPLEQVTYSAARGKPADALLDEATRLQAGVLVVGNKRMHGVSRVLGSVANKVAHNADCDVYIVNTAYDSKDQ